MRVLISFGRSGSGTLATHLFDDARLERTCTAPPCTCTARSCRCARADGRLRGTVCPPGAMAPLERHLTGRSAHACGDFHDHCATRQHEQAKARTGRQDARLHAPDQAEREHGPVASSDHGHEPRATAVSPLLRKADTSAIPVSPLLRKADTQRHSSDQGT